MRTWEERRQDEDRYRGDVIYDVWRSGRNPDAVDFDRVRDHFDRGDSEEQAAAHEIRLQRQREEARREEREQEEQAEYEAMQQAEADTANAAGQTPPAQARSQHDRPNHTQDHHP